MKQKQSQNSATSCGSAALTCYMADKYDLILADPPWNQKRGGKKKVRENSSGGNLPYQILELKDIIHILIHAKERANDNHILFLWTIDKYLIQTHQILELLGYKIHARMIWNKVTGIPAAFTVRFGHEYLLYCYHGKMLPVAKEARGKIHTVFTEKVKKHSKKPEISYEIINQLFPDAKKLELFARQQRDGWDVWGNEVESTVDLAI